jgi:hypothetical protein
LTRNNTTKTETPVPTDKTQSLLSPTPAQKRPQIIAPIQAKGTNIPGPIARVDANAKLAAPTILLGL